MAVQQRKDLVFFFLFFASNGPQQRSVYSALATFCLIPLFVDKFGNFRLIEELIKGTILAGFSILSFLLHLLLLLFIVYPLL